VEWYTWSPIAEDGSFVIENWPAGEDIQIIALCDGFMAESGEPPAVVDSSVAADAYCRPQVFSPSEEPIMLRMTPMVRCSIEAVDKAGSPLAGVEVFSWPNVGWWNGGSQIYCDMLARSECVVIKRDYRQCLDQGFPDLWRTTTDAKGHATLDLPARTNRLAARHADYELPVVQGRRDRTIRVVADQSNAVRLVLQPKGSEQLGDWDKLAGVLFGCTGEHCRRLLNDPAFRAKMDTVRKSLQEAEDPTDPLLLTAAYAAIADAFEELGDTEEAIKWRMKASQQAARLISTGKPHVGSGP
jgi:hypothetical protein